MKKYRVAICLEEGVAIYVQAENEEDALEKAQKVGEEFGGSNYPEKYNHNCVHRDIFTQDAEEVD
jgi:hypothetical protein